MKKILLLPLFLLVIFRPYSAEATSISESLKDSLILPVLGFVLSFELGKAAIRSLPSVKDLDKGNHKLVVNTQVCNKTQDIYIDLTDENAYIGTEEENLSHYKKADENKKFFTPNTQYLCINRKPTRMFPNGCEDILIKNTQLASGIWFLTKITTVNNEMFLQFKQKQPNKKNLIATTEFDNVIKLLYKDGKPFKLRKSYRGSSNNITIFNFGC